MQLEGRVAIVTGASRGIGRQVALDLARRGMAVVVAARTVDAHRRLPGTIADTVGSITDAGGRALAVRTDVTVTAELEHLVATTVDTFGRVDVLVNNAADTNGANAPIDEYPRDKWLREFDANVHAPFTLMAAVVPHMREQGGGAIVNVTSGAGDLVTTATTAEHSEIRVGTLLGYAVTKAALNRLANALAPDLRADGIAVVNVDPGFTRTELVDLLSESNLVDADAAAPMDVTVRAIAQVLTDDDPLRYSGQIVRAWELAG